jgi:integrase
MAHSTRAAVSRKPHPDFPLTPRGDGRWCKKIKGKLYYFRGTAEEALAEWLRVKDDLLAGRTPRPAGDGLTVEHLLDCFLNSKRPLLESGELAKRTFDDYYATCRRIGAAFELGRLADDLRPDDFEALRRSIAKVWGPVALGNEINRIRVVFKYAYDAGLLDRPMRYGPGFKRPSRKTLRIERAKKGPRMFEARHVRRLLKAASPQMRAMILLAMNAGLGNHDCGALRQSALDLKGGWLNYPRPKTGIDRRCPLWPETVEALRVVTDNRPKAKPGAEDLVFVTRCGQSWTKNVADSPITKKFRKLLDALGLYRPGLGFYALRHTFETIAGETADQVAVDHIMGHARDDMASVYRERISDERLIAVANHVRRWLFRKGEVK